MISRKGEEHRLKRSPHNRVLGGVLAGASEALGIDAGLLRALVVLLSVFTMGAPFIVYAVLWVALPLESAVPPIQPQRNPDPVIHPVTRDTFNVDEAAEQIRSIPSLVERGRVEWGRNRLDELQHLVSDLGPVIPTDTLKYIAYQLPNFRDIERTEIRDLDGNGEPTYEVKERPIVVNTDPLRELAKRELARRPGPGASPLA